MRRNRPFVGTRANRLGPRIAVTHAHLLIVPILNLWAGVSIVYDPLGRSVSRRGPQMSATPNSTLAKPEQVIANLQRQLAES